MKRLFTKTIFLIFMVSNASCDASMFEPTEQVDREELRHFALGCSISYMYAMSNVPVIYSSADVQTKGVYAMLNVFLAAPILILGDIVSGDEYHDSYKEGLAFGGAICLMSAVATHFVSKTKWFKGVAERNFS